MPRGAAPKTVAVFLSALLSALLVTGASPPPAAAAGADPWFGPDKLEHFEAAGVLAAGGYAGASLATDDWRLRATAGFGLGVAAGAAKELWDLDGHGDPSWRDFTWDVVGAVAGVVLARTFDWLIHRYGSAPGPAGR
jgi:putative lipoprotein